MLQTALKFTKKYIYFSRRLSSLLRATVFRVDSFLRSSSRRELVSGVFSEESGKGSGRRERCVYGSSIKAISKHIHPADLLQARAVMGFDFIGQSTSRCERICVCMAVIFCQGAISFPLLSCQRVVI